MKARLLQAWLVTVPIAMTMMSVTTALAPGVTLPAILTNAVWGSVRTAASVAFLLGMALMIPIFAEGSRERVLGIMINLQAVLFLTIGLEISASRFGVSFRSMVPTLDSSLIFLFDHLLQTTIIFLLGIALLYLGLRKLRRLE